VIGEHDNFNQTIVFQKENLEKFSIITKKQFKKKKT
jgi:hypothetical protein